MHVLDIPPGMSPFCQSLFLVSIFSYLKSINNLLTLVIFQILCQKAFARALATQNGYHSFIPLQEFLKWFARYYLIGNGVIGGVYKHITTHLPILHESRSVNSKWNASVVYSGRL